MLSDYFDKPKILSHFQPNEMVNPLFSNQESLIYHEELAKMCQDVELYYAPRKIVCVEKASLDELTNHLNSIFDDIDFSTALSKVLKGGHTTPKESRNWVKKFKKRCQERKNKK